MCAGDSRQCSISSALCHIGVSRSVERNVSAVRRRVWLESEGACWVSVFVQFFRFIDQLGRDLGTLGVPLSQWDTPGLQNRFLFRA